MPIALGLGAIVLGLAVPWMVSRSVGSGSPAAAAMPLVSLLSPISPTSNANLTRSLEGYGYRRDENIRLTFTYANRHEELLDALAAGIVATRPQVIVAMNPTAAAAAHRATRTIPIVFAALGDPVRMGLVESLARPGGNVTGITNMPSDLNAKMIEIMHDLLPEAGQIALVTRTGNFNHHLHVADEIAAARTFGVDARVYDIEGPEAFEAACGAMIEAGIRTAVIMPDSTYTTHEPEMMAAALRHRLAVIANSRDFARAGALLSYGPDYGRLYATMMDPVARYVDRILRGANPAELPVDQPMNVRLAVNRHVAGVLGIDLPRSLLVRANELID
jgi:putative ABC transport system substrate-binding protein